MISSRPYSIASERLRDPLCRIFDERRNQGQNQNVAKREHQTSNRLNVLGCRGRGRFNRRFPMVFILRCWGQASLLVQASAPRVPRWLRPLLPPALQPPTPKTRSASRTTIARMKKVASKKRVRSSTKASRRLPVNFIQPSRLRLRVLQAHPRKNAVHIADLRSISARELTAMLTLTAVVTASHLP